MDGIFFDDKEILFVYLLLALWGLMGVQHGPFYLAAVKPNVFKPGWNHCYTLKLHKLRLPLGEKLEWMKNGSWREESKKRRGKQEEGGGKWNKDGITKSDTVTNYFVSWCTTLDLNHYPISLSNQKYFKQIRSMIMLAYAQIFSHLGQQVSSHPSYTSHLNGREF